MKDYTMVHWKDEPTAAVTVASKASTMDRPRDCPNVHLKDVLMAAGMEFLKAIKREPTRA